MRMTRFKISYNISKNLKPDEVDLKKVSDVKITDACGVLPDLSVGDEKIAREWIKYFNTPEDKMRKFEMLSRSIKGTLTGLNDLNDKLVKPAENKYFDEESETEVYIMPLEKRLFYTGYLQEVRVKTNSIYNDLDELKNLIYDYVEKK